MTFFLTRSNLIRRSYASNAFPTLDWGYHVTGFYGIDYRFTAAKGYFSEQLLQSNRQYGFDPVLEYFDLYFPVKDGLNIRIGRFLSVPGIEAQLAPNNYNMTHSLLYPSIPSPTPESMPASS